MTDRAASPALQPPPGNPRYPLMDSLRGLGALAVVFAHVYYRFTGAPPGHHGYLDDLHNTIIVVVPIFFALSGFLLFRPFLAALASGRRVPSAIVFYRRRVLRVVPAYWLALTVCAIVFPVAAVGAFSHRWWVFYLFGQSFSLTDNFHGIAVAWTLSVDAGFYLVLPGLAWLVARWAPRIGWERAAWRVVVPMLVLGPVVHTLNTFTFASRDLVVFIQKITYALPGETNHFGVGMALAVLTLRERPPRLAQRPALTWFLAGLVFALIAAFFSFNKPYGNLDFRTRFILNDLLTMVFVVLAMLPAAFDVHPGLPRRVLAWPPLLFVGAVSYGLYIWHFPTGQWLLRHGLGPVQAWDYVPRLVTTYAAVLALALVLATASYYVVEPPFLRLKERRRAP